MDNLLPMSPDSFVTYVSRPYPVRHNKPFNPIGREDAPSGLTAALGSLKNMANLLPFEKTILISLGAAISPGLRGQFSSQVDSINKVQRLLDWKEIEFYCMRWFKVRWPQKVLFQNQAEFVLGSGTLEASGITAAVNVWAVGGHVFSIESEVSLKQFKSAKAVSFVVSQSAAQPITQHGRAKDGAPVS